MLIVSVGSGRYTLCDSNPCHVRRPLVTEPVAAINPERHHSEWMGWYSTMQSGGGGDGNTTLPIRTLDPDKYVPGNESWVRIYRFRNAKKEEIWSDSTYFQKLQDQQQQEVNAIIAFCVFGGLFVVCAFISCNAPNEEKERRPPETIPEAVPIDGQFELPVCIAVIIDS